MTQTEGERVIEAPRREAVAQATISRLRSELIALGELAHTD